MKKIVLLLNLIILMTSSFAAGFGGGPVWVRPETSHDDYDVGNSDHEYNVQYNQQQVGDENKGDATVTNLNNGNVYNVQGNTTNQNGQRTVNATVSNNQNSNTYQVNGNQSFGCNGSSCTKTTTATVQNNQTGTSKTYSNTQQTTEVNTSTTTVYPEYYPYPYYYAAPMPIMVGGATVNGSSSNSQNYNPNLINTKESQPIHTESEVIFSQ